MNQYENFKEDYYSLLGVDRNDDEKTIRKAYIEKINYYQPDFGNVPKEVAERMMMLLNDAKEYLLDAEKRERYDAFWDRTYKTKTDKTELATRKSGTLAKPEDIKDYYNALNISRINATEETITAAYLAVLKQFKSQLNGENSLVAQNIIACAEEAYGVLSHPESRELYNTQYDQVYLAKLSDTPRVSGEITVVKPMTIERKKSEQIVTKVRPQNDLVLERRSESTMTNYRTTAPVVQSKSDQMTVMHNNKKAIIGAINQRLLSFVKNSKLSSSLPSKNKVSLKKLYAIISEDNSFIFAEECCADPIESLYYLRTVPGRTKITGDFALYENGLPWRQSELIKIKGLKSIIMPAVKIIPIQLINRAGLFDTSDYIKYEDLQEVHSQVLTVLSHNFDLVADMFDKREGKKM